MAVWTVLTVLRVWRGGVLCVWTVFITFNEGGVLGFGCLDSFDSFDSFKGLGFGFLDNFDSFDIFEEGVLGVWTVLTILRGGVFGVDSFNNFGRGALSV